MSKAAPADRAPAAPVSEPLAGPGAIALIGDPEKRAPIAEVLTHEGFGFDGFESASGLLGRAGARPPWLIVVSVEDVDSLAEAIAPLTESFPETPTVLVCSSIERWGVREALTAGAAGVVLAEDLELALAPTMLAALGGQTCVPRRHGRQIEPPALSSREKQILGLVVMGYANGEIARQLFLAESTVKSHLSSAFGKLGVRSRNDAVRLILDPARGLGMGILALGGEPVESLPVKEG
jgi:DNA-binding NarL/FixJ family response regulator